MGLFKSKEEKAEIKKKQQEAAENAKAEAEWEAKYAAKTEKKKVQKLIAEIEQKEQALIKNAAEAKSKGYMDVYRTQISFIKVARTRKMQAEKFLFQVDAMEEYEEHKYIMVGRKEIIITVKRKRPKFISINTDVQRRFDF